MYKKFLSLFGVICLLLCMASCSASGGAMKGDAEMSNTMAPSDMSHEEYLELQETGFISTEVNNKLNVSMDSSNAAYSNIRKRIELGYLPHKDSVNIEQMLNYFNYSYKNESDEQLQSFLELSDCPWDSETKLLSVAIKAKDIEIENKTPSNFVFLLDVSGSMYSEDKLPLMINAFKLLIDNLDDNDRVSIVTYAGSDKVLLEGAYGHEKTKISAIISDLEAGGSTAGSKGIKTAYELAEKYFIEGGNNRVFLATDGDFNVGIRSTDGLKKFISQKRETGVYLSLFGFGSGNYHGSTMDTLAQAGNGNHYYIDSILEAQKVFVSEIGGTLQTVAKDAKAQIEFNPEVVEKYRVIGYENKILTDEEFENSETDAGEIGAGHATICLVEVKLKEGVNLEEEQLYASCKLRYKDVLDSELNKEVINEVKKFQANASADFYFASAVAEFGLYLRQSEFALGANLDSVLANIQKGNYNGDPYKEEFYQLVLKAKEFEREVE